MTQMTHATFNITTNRFKVYPLQDGSRLTPEEDKARKYACFQWYPGQKCFSAIYSPQAEDWILSFGITIDEDDTPDDVEARVDRYSQYAENDERTAQYAQDRIESGAANTARRLRLAQGVAESKAEEAQYWHSRIAGAISHAAYKDKPDVIARRIKGLEADKRKHERNLADAQKFLAAWTECFPDDKRRALYISNYDHGGDWYGLEQGTTTPAAARTHGIESYTSSVQHESRWLAHLEKRLEYETAYLEAVGGGELLHPEPKPRRIREVPDDGLKKGMQVTYNPQGWSRERWSGTILSMGAANVRVSVPAEHDPRGFYQKNGIQILRRYVKAAETEKVD